jgi:hypothetical protein
MKTTLPMDQMILVIHQKLVSEPVLISHISLYRNTDDVVATTNTDNPKRTSGSYPIKHVVKMLTETTKAESNPMQFIKTRTMFPNTHISAVTKTPTTPTSCTDH